MAGITWVCKRLEEYLLGKFFTIQTDHLPLLSILKEKPINDLTVRLQRFRLRLTRFTYEIEHVPGRSFHIPDRLSRRPLPEGDKDKDVFEEEEVIFHVNVINKQLLEDDLKTSEKRITEAQKREFMKLGEYVEKGWPDKKKVTEECQKYFKYKKDNILQGHPVLQGYNNYPTISIQRNIKKYTYWTSGNKQL
ncbi:hypothetical protein NQ314_015231 [Rhamnusium bicolor]|uniref:Reverse transcriptase RNase H-like domain-containing protein n=1 Tax=Rhamnusium bicolor TaxID=1586634 RepID=A0AAV8WZ80_9CUCU|nr:hypothetical protein NQ314_015231 [Rhamnusium bicolor]